MPTKKPATIYWFTVGIMVANVISYTIFTFVEIFACFPMSKAWDPIVSDGYCVMDILTVNTAISSLNTGSDIIILIIPQLVIWRLNMTWREKAAVSAVFMVAILYKYTLGVIEIRAYANLFHLGPSLALP